MSDTTVLSTAFRRVNPSVFFGRARLFDDRIELTGWSWRGRYRHTVRLAEVAQVEWRDGGQRNGPNFGLSLHDGTRHDLWLRSAGLWKFEVEARTPHLVRTVRPPVKSMTTAA